MDRESGEFDSVATRQLLHTVLQPMLANQVDTVVLGCTHYPFVVDEIRAVVGTAVSSIDPAPAVARQTKRVLERGRLLNITKGTPHLRLITTGSQTAFANFVKQTLSLKAVVETAVWQDGQVTITHNR